MNDTIATIGTQSDIVFSTQDAVELARSLGFGKRSNQKSLKSVVDKEIKKVPALFSDECDCWGGS
jgi:hypothetical protein